MFVVADGCAVGSRRCCRPRPSWSRRAARSRRRDRSSGNLVEPLSRLQLAGIWPAGDFRFEPGDLAPTYILIGLLLAAAVIGLWWAWRRRAWELLLYVIAAVGGALAISIEGSPWVGAKALATGSPAILLAGMAGAAALAARGRRVEATVLAVAIAAGVVWSNALAYHEVNLAPRDRHEELEQIGEAIAGEGPTLMTEYEPYGVRHFLRKGDPEGASELRRRPVLLRSGRQLEKLEVADVDEFADASLLVYRTLVLRRSPVASRPPSIYTRVRSGRYYDVWQRAAGIRAHGAPAPAARLRRARVRAGAVRQRAAAREPRPRPRAGGWRWPGGPHPCGWGWRRRPDRTGAPTRPSKEP